MKTWLTSLHGAVTLSVLALLTFLARAMGLDAMFVLPGELGVGQDQPATVAQLMLWVMALFGGWIWALLVAVRGGRGGVLAALIFSLLSGLLGGFSLLVFCAHEGCAVPPVGNVIVTAQLITGLAASAAMWLQLRPARKRETVIAL